MDLKDIARLRVTCPDKPGIIAAVTSFLHHHGANITALDQHATEAYGGTLYLRLEFQTPHLDVSGPALERAFQDVVAVPFDMAWEITYGRNIKRTAILVSRQEHCLMELLWRFARGELPCDITMVVSNHPDQREAVENFGIPYHYVPVDGDKEASEARMLELMEGEIDLVVLARYMQILSPSFVERFPNRIINIHHSFLPAFAGADPYRQAYERGVKLIGATAHYVTAELDGGPIIEQDVTRVSHRHSVENLRAIGRDLERQVLARAVASHLNDRIIVSGNKTWVF
ncbi:formyltetrahydrofolate deformylase [Oceanidesulfovibrio marinus]|uniref:Formyltetrahydrofolate deformylase n=1 Tax=Oceanidesulfovibrio marinus TaxID=370038 RepID=A0A6P1ZM78_9BACT|nr:formyltetrahydrofolate deformylase [Oceanidesulfovibrio marinus]QJT09132.1 formyltetrahydrofolate deformylase [Oceanidesulfovibrio marinus]TVM36439.1 formyltetrahydrofolate deformylase [Oceanidesulfovibrio marinus]